MIDIHSHILPGVDDGAQDPEVARRMAEASQALSQSWRDRWAAAHTRGLNHCTARQAHRTSAHQWSRWR